MIFIADGGSTKVDWRILQKSGVQSEYSTIGFNPFFYTSEMVVEELQKSFAKDLPVESVEKVFFYGSGCSDSLRKNILKVAFEEVMPNADVMVSHDLLACAKATCGNEPGIACIMGTGSNTGLYDGKTIIDNVTNLGYLLGDEGSGTHLGRKLITSYFYRELPPDLVIEFDKTYNIGKRELLNNLYEGERANVYLASFSKFLSDHKENLFIQQLVHESFGEFIERHVMKYEGHQTLPIHFVGSIAFYFSFILESLLSERKLILGSIIKKPIDNLVNYHLQNEKAFFKK